MFYINEHITELMNLRAVLVQKRRASTRDGKIEEFENTTALIEAVDRSILDEKRLANLVD